MADKTIGSLDPIENLYSGVIIPGEYNGEPVKFTLEQFREFIAAAARQAAFGIASDGGKIIVGAKNFGAALPETGTEGQLFFLLK